MTSPYDHPAITVGELRALLADLPEDALISSTESDYENMGSYVRFLSRVHVQVPYMPDSPTSGSPTSPARTEVSFFFGLTGLERWVDDEQVWDDDDDDDDDDDPDDDE